MTPVPRSTRRPGYSLIELVVVVAIVALIGVAVIPSLFGMRGNSRVKAAGDDATGLIALARSHALEEGRSYKLAVSEDGTKLRVSPDDPTALEQTEGEDVLRPFVQEILLPVDVTIGQTGAGSEQSTADAEGWIRLATFQQDGTCREDLVDFEIREQGVTPLVVQIRGLTGHATVNPSATAKK